MVVRSPGVQGGESGMSHQFSLAVQDGVSPLYAASEYGGCSGESWQQPRYVSISVTFDNILVLSDEP